MKLRNIHRFIRRGNQTVNSGSVRFPLCFGRMCRPVHKVLSPEIDHINSDCDSVTVSTGVGVNEVTKLNSNIVTLVPRVLRVFFQLSFQLFHKQKSHSLMSSIKLVFFLVVHLPNVWGQNNLCYGPPQARGPHV